MARSGPRSWRRWPAPARRGLRTSAIMRLDHLDGDARWRSRRRLRLSSTRTTLPIMPEDSTTVSPRFTAAEHRLVRASSASAAGGSSGSRTGRPGRSAAGTGSACPAVRRSGGGAGGLGEGGGGEHGLSGKQCRRRAFRAPVRSRRKLCAAPSFCNGTRRAAKRRGHGRTTLEPVLTRIAEALERLAPPRRRRARLRRRAAVPPRPGDRRLPSPRPTIPCRWTLLVGVDRQKARFVENLRALRRRPARPTTPCSGACAAPARARWPRRPSWPWPPSAAALKLVEVDRDEVTALPALFDVLRAPARAVRGALRRPLVRGGRGGGQGAEVGAGGRRLRPAGQCAVRRHLQPPPPDAARPRRGPRPDRHRRGRRGGGQRLRPLRPVDRLPADGPADLPGRRRRPTPSASA